MNRIITSGILIGIAAGIASAMGWVFSQKATPPAAIGQWVSSAEPPPQSAKCADCHQDIYDGFANAGHANTLWSGDDPDMIAKFAGQHAAWPADGTEFRYELNEGKVWLTRDGSPHRLPVDWFFGSGHHAVTPVALLRNPDGESVIRQHALTWYPETGLAPTPGRDANAAVFPGTAGLGEWSDHAGTLNCFGCHTTHLPLEGEEIRQEGLMVGVQCARCHFNATAHVAADGEVHGTLERWRAFTPRESIQRCGECHRRADQMTEQDQNPNRIELARFASVGLVLSPCFKGQDETGPDRPPVRLDCMTCHDPHQAIEKDTAVYQRVCLSCHTGNDAFAPMCSVQPIESNCLSCHMPTEETEPHLSFTDHWIRIRGGLPVNGK